MKKLIPVILLVLAALPGFAQLKLRLEFPEEGTRQAWVAAGPPRDKLPETTPLKGKTAEFQPGSFGPGDRLYILDESSGNLASKPLSEISEAWTLKPEDFAKIGEVRVRVEYGGLPIEAASVALKSGKDERSQLIDKSSLGETVFYGVDPGSVEVTVQYKTKAGESAEPVTQSTRLGLRRQKEALVVVSVPEEAATVTGGQSEEVKRAQAESESESKGGMGGFGNVISFLTALGIAAAAVFFGLKWMKQNQDAVQAKLSQMGVEVPSSEPAAADGNVAPAPIAPPPPAQILLDDAAPTPLSTAPVDSAATAIIGEPRLVAADGSELPLDEGVTTVGREAGMGLSLLEESTVSRRHAEIVRSGPSVLVRDLDSTNGTFVNGVQIQGDIELKPGDQVQFGAIRFRFEV